MTVKADEMSGKNANLVNEKGCLFYRVMLRKGHGGLYKAPTKEE